MNVNALSSLKNNLSINTPRIETRFTPVFYWNNASSNIELNSVSTRLQRQHNEYFRSVELTNLSLNKFKTMIMNRLPNENWI